MPYPEERKKTRNWWVRELRGEYFPAISLDDPAIRGLLEREGWLPAGEGEHHRD